MGSARLRALLSCCCALAAIAEQHQLQPLSRLLGAANGREAGHIYSEEKYLGEGLASTFEALLGETPPPSPIGTVYCSFNGERYWAREFGRGAACASRSRSLPTRRWEHPAECFGDMGSAHGPALAGAGAHTACGMVTAPRHAWFTLHQDHGDRGGFAARPRAVTRQGHYSWDAPSTTSPALPTRAAAA